MDAQQNDTKALEAQDQDEETLQPVAADASQRSNQRRDDGASPELEDLPFVSLPLRPTVPVPVTVRYVGRLPPRSFVWDDE
jgi:hypothetical protein